MQKHVSPVLALILIGSTVPFFSMITTHAMEAVTLRANAEMNTQMLHPAIPESRQDFRLFIRDQQGKVNQVFATGALKLKPCDGMPLPFMPMSMTGSKKVIKFQIIDRQDAGSQRNFKPLPPNFKIPKNPEQQKREDELKQESSSSASN